MQVRALFGIFLALIVGFCAGGYMEQHQKYTHQCKCVECKCCSCCQHYKSCCDNGLCDK